MIFLNLGIFMYLAGYVQTKWGLVEIGGYYGPPWVSTDEVEYTSDGITWEKLPTKLPGLIVSLKKCICIFITPN